MGEIVNSKISGDGKILLTVEQYLEHISKLQDLQKEINLDHIFNPKINDDDIKLYHKLKKHCKNNKIIVKFDNGDSFKKLEKLKKHGAIEIKEIEKLSGKRYNEVILKKLII